MMCSQLYILIFCIFVYVQGIDIDFYDAQDGFFLKSPYHKFKPAEPNVVKESLILTHPAEVYKLRAKYGPFEMYEVVPNEILTTIDKYDETEAGSSPMQRQVMHGMDVSAHIVAASISQANPIIQVLVNAPLLSHRNRKSQDLIYSYYGYRQQHCAQIFASRGGEQYSAVCIIQADTHTCVAGISVPDHWWDTSNSTLRSQDVHVYYDISLVEENQECASVSNTIIPARAEAVATGLKKKFISTVELARESLQYQDHEDKDLVFRIPRSDIRAGTRFEVPVLLEKDSTMTEFVIQVQVRGGVRIEGASTDISSPWTVIFEAGEGQGEATVTAIIKPDVKATKSFKQEEIMRWQFRAFTDSDSPSTGRISWNVNYERNGLERNSYFSPEGTQLMAKFNIISVPTEALVAVMKEQYLLNTAMLTGQLVTHDLTVFSVTSDNSFTDVTVQASCRSTDPGALKVSPDCDQVFLDGTETRGADNVTILVRLEQGMAQLGVTVWVPEDKLDVQLSDSRLSQVRGWKVDRSPPRSRRSVDLGLLTNVFTDNQKQNCRYKYQQAMVDVYARFVIQTPGMAVKFFKNKKTLVRVTSMVQDRVKVTDDSVARVYKGTVVGVAPGRTEVQVVTPSGRVLGSREVRVGKDKVDMERLMVRVISGMSLRITEDRNLPGALMATVYLRDQLTQNLQEAVLDIAVEFKDGTILPLDKIDPNEYNLKVVSIIPGVVDVVSMTSSSFSSSSSLPPSIKAVGTGEGDFVKVTLTERGTCGRKKVRTLDSEYVHVQVDFAKDQFYDAPMLQKDGYYNNPYGNNADGSQNRDYGRRGFDEKKDYFDNPYHDKEKDRKEPKFGKSSKFGRKPHPREKAKSKMDTLTQMGTEADAATQEPNSEALEQPVSTAVKNPSPLEVGMYVLVAVFIFAILVFTANCAVFMVRYNRKRSPKGGANRVAIGSIDQAPDWVWIGRDTLARHGASESGCNQALMAEEDFNGNHQVVPHTLPSQGSQGSRRGRGSSTSGVTGSGSNRDSMVSTYQGSECSVRITANPLLDVDTSPIMGDSDSGMGYNEAEWDYEAMGMTYEQLMDYFHNLKESSA